jgi:hypothetical protein
MHFCWFNSTGSASFGRDKAPEGQTVAQGASSQCRHWSGTASPAADSM